MALGVDQIAASAAIELDIPFIAAVPFLGQEKMWPTQSQDFYNLLISAAEDVVIVCDGDYSPQKMQTRNKWMVDKCDVLIAVFDGTPGGTKNCVDYAISKEKEIIKINPDDLRKEIECQH